MNGSLGRDKVWASDIWSDIDKAVMTEAEHVQIVRQVFPTTPMPNAQSVPADIFDPVKMEIQEGQTTPLVEISVPFSLTQSQVDDETSNHTGQKLSRLAAKTLGLSEDIILFQGQRATLAQVVQIANLAAAGTGLIQEAAEEIPVDRADPGYPASVFQAVADGIARLTAKGQPGPYALFLESSVYADVYRPEPNSLVTPADRIRPLVTAGFYPTGALLVTPAGRAAAAAPGRFGVLASLGGEPVSIYVGVDATTAFTQADPNGILRFRVYERVQHVARDRTALLRLAFIN
jgi:uncharacterized linocin/CFP29 family protein